MCSAWLFLFSSIFILAVPAERSSSWLMYFIPGGLQIDWLDVGGILVGWLVVVFWFLNQSVMMVGNAEPGKGQLWKVLCTPTCVVVLVYVYMWSYPRIGTKGLPTDLVKPLTPSCSFHALFPKAFYCLKMPTELSKALSSLDTQADVTLMGLICLTLSGSFENSSRSPFAMPKSLQSIIRICFCLVGFVPGAALPNLAKNSFRNGKGCKVLTHWDNQLGWNRTVAGHASEQWVIYFVKMFKTHHCFGLMSGSSLW